MIFQACLDNGDSKDAASLAVKHCGLTRHDNQQCLKEWFQAWSTVEKAELEAEMALLYWLDRNREMD